MNRSLGVLLLRTTFAAFTLACARTESRASTDSTTVIPAAADTLSGPGIRFDASALRAGMRVGELTVESLTVRRAIDSSWVGTARFSGELTLSGRFVSHPDSDIRALCFEADSASAARMPRWGGDSRRPWLCFEKAGTKPTPPVPPFDVQATVVIDRFTIHRGLSDEVNSARLLRVVAD